MHHIEKYVFQQETVAPGLGLLSKGILGWEPPISITCRIDRSLCRFLKRPLGGRDPVADWRGPLGTRWARKTESFSSGMPAALDHQPGM